MKEKTIFDHAREKRERLTALKKSGQGESPEAEKIRKRLSALVSDLQWAIEDTDPTQWARDFSMALGLPYEPWE